MMKIVAIDTYPLILPVKEIYGGAAGFLEDCRSLIVRVEMENGIEGWGEGTQGRPGNTYETLETMEIMVQNYFAPALIGMDLEETGTVLSKLHRVRYGHPIAKAAIETALFDALGKLYRVPLCRFFGGPYRREIELVGGLGIDLGPETIGPRAGQLKQEGFQAFKIKIGQEDHQKDIERVRAVRQAVGAAASIRVDGNASYSFTEPRRTASHGRYSHRCAGKRELAGRGAGRAGRASRGSFEDQAHAYRRISKGVRGRGGRRRQGTSGCHRPGQRMHDDTFRRRNAASLRVKEWPTGRRNDRFHAARRAKCF